MGGGRAVRGPLFLSEVTKIGQKSAFLGVIFGNFRACPDVKPQNNQNLAIFSESVVRIQLDDQVPVGWGRSC